MTLVRASAAALRALPGRARLGKSLLLVLLLGPIFGLGLGAQALRAQQVPDEFDQSRYGRASVYRYADPDDVTIQVSVWGAVRNAGVYELPRDAHLNLLFSAAGGPQIGVRERVDDQTITVQLVRNTESGERRVVYEQTMEDELIVDEENPSLQDGDVLTVNSYVVRGVNWQDVLSIGTSLASLVLTAVSLATR